MSDTPKKELTDKEKADMAFNALTIKTMETSAKLDRVEKQLAQQKNRTAKTAARTLKKNKRAAEKKRYSTEIPKLAKLGKPTQMLQGLSSTTKIPKTK